MSDELTYYKEMDAPDVGDALSFFATQSHIDDNLWYWIFGLQFRSTYLYGGTGKAGDGIDVVLLEGRTFLAPQKVEEEGLEQVLSDIADAHLPSVPPEVLTEYTDDSDLCDVAEIMRDGNWKGSFEEAYFSVTEVDDPDEHDRERAAEVLEYARENGWNFAEED